MQSVDEMNDVHVYMMTRGQGSDRTWWVIVLNNRLCAIQSL